MDRRHRLTQQSQFQRTRREGRSWSHLLLAIVVLKTDLPVSRFGFLVSRRVGGAVVRNRVKRLMREAMRARLAEVHTGYNVVLIARQASANANLANIKNALDAQLRRASLLKEPSGSSGTLS